MKVESNSTAQELFGGLRSGKQFKTESLQNPRMPAYRERNEELTKLRNQESELTRLDRPKARTDETKPAKIREQIKELTNLNPIKRGRPVGIIAKERSDKGIPRK